MSIVLIRLFAAGVLAARAPLPSPLQSQLIDLNRASVAELCTLPGFGRARALAVVLTRVRHGWFRSLDELGRVDGIGPSTLAQIRAHVVDPALPRNPIQTR